MQALLNILSQNLDKRAQQGTLKGAETVITGVLPGQDNYGPRYLIQGQGERPFLRMNSNSYLGLSHHPELLAAAEKAAETFGVGPGAVRFISGTTTAHIELEAELARFHERPAAMIFNCAYAAVLGVLPPLISPDSVVISDELNHNSIINALRLAKPAAKKIYGHLNMAELGEQIKASIGLGQRLLVVSDGIFSMRGDHAPLREIKALCQRYQDKFAQGILTIIDDSHGVGVFGKTGRGCEEYCSTTMDLVIGTLGKAFGVNGGYVVGPQEIIDYLRETAPCYIYSNPITPGEAAAARQSIMLADSSEGQARLAKLRALTKRLEQGLVDLGYQVILSEHPIVPVVTGHTATNRRLADFLFEHGILATPLSYPVVPKGADEIRLQICAAHHEADIDLLLTIMNDFRR